MNIYYLQPAWFVRDAPIYAQIVQERSGYDPLRGREIRGWLETLNDTRQRDGLLPMIWPKAVSAF